jgi:pantothenate kinase
MWREKGRPGVIEVPGGIELLIVEGAGAAHASVSELLDATIWVQADRMTARTRGIERDLASGENGDQDATLAFWAEWDKAERDYLALDRPWDRASVIVAGTPPFPVPPGKVALADPA